MFCLQCTKYGQKLFTVFCLGFLAEILKLWAATVVISARNDMRYNYRRLIILGEPKASQTLCMTSLWTL